MNNVGVGKECGEAVLHYDEPGSGLASLTKRNLVHEQTLFDKSEVVRLTTIDDYCSENNICRINLLKLDIEGHELNALVGASALFRRQAIDVVTFEFGGCNIDTRSFFKDYWLFFVRAGMELFRITPSGYFNPIHRYGEFNEQFVTTNYMAVAKGRLAGGIVL